MRIRRVYPTHIIEGIVAAQAADVSALMLDDNFVQELRYIGRHISYRRLSGYYSCNHQNMSAWARGLYLPRDAESRILTHQIYIRLRQVVDKGEIRAVIS